MQALSPRPVAAHLGARFVAPGSMLQHVPSCKPAAGALRLRFTAGRDAAALLGTRPVVSGGERAQPPQHAEAALEASKRVITAPALRREVSGNLHRLFEYRELFGEQFVGRQCWVCLELLGGLASDF